jgi:hypothetical protein
MPANNLREVFACAFHQHTFTVTAPAAQDVNPLYLKCRLYSAEFAANINFAISIIHPSLLGILKVESKNKARSIRAIIFFVCYAGEIPSCMS